jgi:hypothetical protein
MRWGMGRLPKTAWGVVFGGDGLDDGAGERGVNASSRQIRSID